MKKCGFITILGAPNAGKSTLTNCIVGTKVSIVTHKVQTTRQKILGITIYDNAQIILIDTPGIFKAKRKLDRAMVNAAYSSSKDADIVFVMFDVTKSIKSKSYKETIEILDNVNHKHICLILNKIDQVDKGSLLSIVELFEEYTHIKKIFMISALKADGVMDLKAYAHENVSEGPWLFPEDDITDMPKKLWASEITREQVFRQLHQELPYDIFVETENFEYFENGDLKINQVIYVAKMSQKGIVLGHKGAQVKRISKNSREEISLYLNCKVHLFLHVKVKENWAEKPSIFQQMNLDINS